MRLRVATYNVHGFRGRDGVQDPARVAAVVRELDADIVGLQEVVCAPRPDPGHPEGPPVCDSVATLAELARHTGHTPLTGMNMDSLRSPCCNALLVRTERLAVRESLGYDLSRPGREPREMVMAVLDAPGSSLRVASVHLGLGPVERPSQLAQLVGLCKGFGRRETILLGDFNEWKPFGRTSRRLTDDLGAPPLGPTFPVGWRILGIPIPPLLQLDRIGLSEDLSLVDAGAHVSDLARTASDHLPLVGVVERA